MQVAHLAYGFEIPVSMMNCTGNLMAHLAAALPNHMMMEVVAMGRDAILNVDNHIEDGWIVLGHAPGVGITFDEDKLEKAAVDRATRQVGRSPSGRRRGAGLCEVPYNENEDEEVSIGRWEE
jgi:L-alanine-DL-glutamate epimerase-like enolase superfamily enzyme